jgi:methylglyoxal synthase
MELRKMPIPAAKSIALVAHDNKKQELYDWVQDNREALKPHRLWATGTTGSMLRVLGLEIASLESGPLGGDQQIGAKIAQDEIDMVIFFWDPLEPLPHDPDIKALIRLAAVWNVPVACNRSSADFIITSPLMDREYGRLVPDYSAYRARLNATKNG